MIDPREEILDSIQIMVNKAIKAETTKIYTATVTNISGVNRCDIILNNQTYTVQYYGDIPIVNNQYRVFVPFGEMPQAFIITGGGSTPAGTDDYTQLINKPSINSVQLLGNQTSSELGLYGTDNPPDYPVDSVNSKTGAIVLDATDVGALPDTTPIPTKTSQLTNDSGYGDMLKGVYDTNDNGIVDNAEKVNGHTVLSDVPADTVFFNYTPVNKSGDTMTGGLTAPTLIATNYFRTPSLVGEGDTSTYYHRMDAGFAGHNYWAWYDYGGEYRFYINTTGTLSGAKLIGTIKADKGWVGNVEGNVTGDASTVNNHTVNKDVPSNAAFTDTTYVDATASVHGLMSSSDKTKLDGVATGANNYSLPVATSGILGGVKSGTDITVDSSGNVSVADNSHNHTVSNVTGLQTALDAKIATSLLGTNNGVAQLGSDGKVPSTQLPSYTVSSIVDLTATAAELNVLDGITASTTELNCIDGVTSNIQTQLDSKANTSSLAAVATSGSYSDLSNKPAIPAISNTMISRANDNSAPAGSAQIDANLLDGYDSGYFANIQLSSTQPTGQRTNDFWLQIV